MCNSLQADAVQPLLSRCLLSSLYQLLEPPPAETQTWFLVEFSSATVPRQHSPLTHPCVCVKGLPATLHFKA